MLFPVFLFQPIFHQVLFPSLICPGPCFIFFVSGAGEHILSPPPPPPPKKPPTQAPPTPNVFLLHSMFLLGCVFREISFKKMHCFYFHPRQHWSHPPLLRFLFISSGNLAARLIVTPKDSKDTKVREIPLIPPKRSLYLQSFKRFCLRLDVGRLWWQTYRQVFSPFVTPSFFCLALLPQV